MEIKYDSTEGKCVSVIRCTSMLSVLLCHITRMIDGFQALNQIFGCATFTFLFISGVLYGSRLQAEYNCDWLKKQYKKIMFPVCIWSVVLIVLNYALGNTISVLQCITNFLGLSLFGNELPGGGHLYFVTIILLCYSLTLLLQSVCMKIKNPMPFGIILTAVCIAGGIAGIISAGRAFFYINVYILAFLYAKYKCGTSLFCSKIQYLILSILACALWLLRLLLNIQGKDDSYFYMNILNYLSGAVLGIWIFFSFMGMRKYVVRLTEICRIIEPITYEIYIVHFCIIVSPVSGMELPFSILVNAMICIFASFVLAIGLNKVSDRVLKLLG